MYEWNYQNIQCLPEVSSFNSIAYILNIWNLNMYNQLKLESLQNHDKFPKEVCVYVCVRGGSGVTERKSSI